MAVYVITGKLGGGKSIMSVSKVRDYLNQDRIVATNIDLNLHWLVRHQAKKCRVMRVPDKPTVFDLNAIGLGNPLIARGIKDESRNGLLLLDECGTWFNSRDWNDKGRKDLIDWIIHARKRGWDIGFIVQDLSVLDKQARVMFAEHVVYCRRTDRMTIPFIGSLYRMITGTQLKLPKMHVGVVKYGTERHSMTVDKWTCFGSGLYNAYNTSQIFTSNYDHGVYSYLPPYYTHYRYRVTYDFRNIMRITKIYFKRFKKVTCFAGGCLLSLLWLEFNAPPEAEVLKVSPTEYANYKIMGYYKMPNQPYTYSLQNSNGTSISSIQLKDIGFDVTAINACTLKLSNGQSESLIKCR
ncbi:zonular occludens toxin domain-containing protein [Photobacterium aquimaris]|uniref:Zonular occludens toxin (Zot) n=1 Tax=Photobacterium aquimaris TaxID=512643 RepID=A0A1Y6KXJ6_9GAMM|nr:zonular occludens toxin domain-containing protein [Photobacterium aquimaris]SMY16096.1 Zonular occludens toxin (Zot) [Photobacterium aquimaris]